MMMPNYVYSTLSVSGSKEDLKIFREKCEINGKLIADNVIPYPRELWLLDKKYNLSSQIASSVGINNDVKLSEEEERELTLIALEGKYDMKTDGYNQGGYDWCCQNWGTKWGFCDCEVEEEDEDFVYYRFFTAWSPIDKVIIEMSKKFPNLLFEYFCDEESREFRFEVEYKGGVRTNYEDRTYEIEEERRQEEEDMKLDQERDKKVEEENE